MDKIEQDIRNWEASRAEQEGPLEGMMDEAAVCTRCGIEMPDEELDDAVLHGDGLCSWCRRMMSKDD
jgi:hypothetical protein